MLTLGAYPEVSLKEAREARDEARRDLRHGSGSAFRTASWAYRTLCTARCNESVSFFLLYDACERGGYSGMRLGFSVGRASVPQVKVTASTICGPLRL